MALTLLTDSYVSLVEADAYFSTRPHTDAWIPLGDTDKENALRMAVFQLDYSYEWKGEVVSSSQILEWPRVNVYDHRGYAVASDDAPSRIKSAQCELAYQWAGADQLTPPTTFLTAADLNSLRQVKREELGPLKTEYFQNQSYLWELADGILRKKIYPYVDQLVFPYSYGRIGGIEVEIMRA